MDHEAAKQIGERFVRACETNDVSDAFAPDVFADINVPLWRFQVQGRDALAEWIRSAQPNGCTVTSWRADATEHGAVVEIVQEYGGEVSRNIHRLDVRDGRIAEWTMYCTGNWSPQAQEMHRQQVTLLRP